MNTVASLLENGTEASHWAIQPLLRQASQLSSRLLKELATNKNSGADWQRLVEVVRGEQELFRDLAAEAQPGARGLLACAEDMLAAGYLHLANAVLDCVLLDELFEHMIDPEVKFAEQKYFREVRESSPMLLQKVVEAKLRYARKREP